jgi:CO/xanthine dehydrogenase Mo-binding subunit
MQVPSATPDLRVIGKPTPQPLGPAKVRGQTLYAADVALPGMLHGKALRSPYPHARIRRIDASRAKAVPGVQEVLTAADIPPALVGRQMHDMPMLARDRVRFVGERVAVVAAEDLDAAEEAVKLIDVEYEELPAIFDPLAAIQQDAPVLHENPSAYQGAHLPIPPIPNACSQITASHGDVAQGFAESDFIFEHSFTLQAVHQGYLEPQACVVSLSPSGMVEVWSSNKSPFRAKNDLAQATGVPAEQIVFHVMNVGGDFGGKGALMDIPLCYFIAERLGRPVKMVMTNTEELAAAGVRHPGVITLRTGVKRDGRLWAQDARLIFNSGAYGAFKPMPHVNIGGVQRVGGSYRVPHVYGESLMVYTNTIPGGFMSAPGSPQMIFAVESQIDIIARELGMDPLEFRRLNTLRQGDTTTLGDPLEHVHGLEILNAAAAAAGWDKPKARNVGRGIAFHDRKTGTGIGSARVTLNEEVRVHIESAVVDAGQGAYNIQQQIVAEVLGLAPAEVSISMTDTSTVPPDSGLGASKTTNVTGHAVLQAAEQLRDRLLDAAASLLDVFPQDVDLVVGGFRRRGEAGSSRPPLLFDEVAREALRREGGPLAFTAVLTPDSPAKHVSSFCAQIAEVEVDTETGQVKVLRFTQAIDSGAIINPPLFEGQIEGSLVQGLGYALSEELRILDGTVQNANLGEYRLQTSRDVPALKTVLLQDVVGPAPFQGRAIAEITNVPVGAAIANAVADAVGVRIFSLPLTAEKLYRALHPEELV